MAHIELMRMVCSSVLAHPCVGGGRGARDMGLLANPLDTSQTQRERPAFLELRAIFTGEFCLGDIEACFGINTAASRDLSLYRRIPPSNLDYNQALHCYWQGQSFKLVHGFHSERVLAWLLHCFGERPDLVSYHRWLRNPRTLYSLESASLASGRPVDV